MPGPIADRHSSLQWRRARLQLAAAALTLTGAGCEHSVLVEAEFPTPVVAPVPLRAGMHFPESLRTYEHAEESAGDAEWVISLGEASTRLFERTFAGLFETAVALPALPAEGGAAADVDLILEPTVSTFEFSLPQQSGTDNYAVWIRYTLNVYRPDGTLIRAWPVSAYGQSPAVGLRPAASMERATEEAMRDAAAKIVTEFQVEFENEPEFREAFPKDGNDEDR